LPVSEWFPAAGGFPAADGFPDRLCRKRRFVKEDNEVFTMSLCGAGRYSEPVFAALPAQKALTTPN
jgi:hypothetical protein